MSFTVHLILLIIICIGFCSTIPLTYITYIDVKEILKGKEEEYEEPVHSELQDDM